MVSPRSTSRWLAVALGILGVGCDGGGGGSPGTSRMDAGRPLNDVPGVDCARDVPTGFVTAGIPSAVSKVKNLLVGLPATDAEIAQVTADPAALDGLVTQWMALPQYAEKMQRFFVSAFQQDQFTYDQLVFQFVQYQLFNKDKAQFVQNLQESFARTAMALIAEGQPFTATLTTHRYMMTPAVMAAHAVLDSFHVDDSYNRTDVFSREHPVRVIVQSTRPVRLEDAVNPASPDFMTFYDPVLANTMGPGCPTGSVTYPSPAESRVVAEILYNHGPWTIVTPVPGMMASPPCMVMPAPASAQYTTPADFSTWQMVTVRTPAPGESTTPLYDLPSMRAGHDLVLHTPRVGFFTTPAFFARWPTNDSNLARVLLNQTMIVALGRPMDLDNTTLPYDFSAIDTAHAAPGTPCYGCHQSLDPMRQFFRQTYTLYGSVQDNPTQTGMPGQFAFHGVSAPGTSIDDLATRLAAHPLFATAWTQRLCTYATSAPCLETDPEFVRLVNVFVSSNYSWNALVQALFASPLVTYLRPTLTAAVQGQTFPITRQEHLCALLSNRLGIPDVCGLDVTTRNAIHAAQVLAPSWPSGQYSRGNPSPSLAVTPSLLMRGGMENICADLANRLVTPDPQSAFPVNDPPTAIRNVVTRLMGLSGDRIQGPLTLLQEHFTEAVREGAAPAVALQSTFTLGCLSPYVAGMGQ